jgi:Cu-Zn family superoxide dismutase
MTYLYALVNEKSEKVLVEGEVNNLKKGFHGFHIHEKGDLSQGCTTAGPHYNPYNKV